MFIHFFLFLNLFKWVQSFVANLILNNNNKGKRRIAYPVYNDRLKSSIKTKFKNKITLFFLHHLLLLWHDCCNSTTLVDHSLVPFSRTFTRQPHSVIAFTQAPHWLTLQCPSLGPSLDSSIHSLVFSGAFSKVSKDTWGHVCAHYFHIGSFYFRVVTPFLGRSHI